MQITITDDDILMSEFKVPEEFYTKRKETPKPNNYLQAYLVDHRIYILVDHNKDSGKVRIFHASISSRESSLFWTDLVRGLGYSDEEQLQQALKDQAKLKDQTRLKNFDFFN